GLPEDARRELALLAGRCSTAPSEGEGPDVGVAAALFWPLLGPFLVDSHRGVLGRNQTFAAFFRALAELGAPSPGGILLPQLSAVVRCFLLESGLVDDVNIRWVRPQPTPASPAGDATRNALPPCVPLLAVPGRRNWLRAVPFLQLLCPPSVRLVHG